MARILKLFLFCFIMLTAAGCSSKMMIPVTEDIEELPADKASITFFRPSNFGGAIQAPLAEEVADDIELIGIVSYNTKIKQIVSPGIHTYVLGGESSSLIKGEVEAGKHYYVRIEPRMGWWKARFVGIAIKADELKTEKIRDQLLECKLVTTLPEASEWFEKNKESMKNKLSDAKEEWDENDPENDAKILKTYGSAIYY